MKARRIKVCGMTDRRNLLEILELDVDAIGVISCPSSPRDVSKDEARFLFDMARSVAPHVERHWVVRDVPIPAIDTALKTGLDCTHVQLHGPYPKEAVLAVTDQQRHAIQVHSVDGPHCPPMLTGCQRILLDAPGPSGGGTGTAFDWTLLKSWVTPPVEVVLAGGLTPEHALHRIGDLPEWINWLDLNSGVELRPGIKDPLQVHAFIESISS